MEIFTQQEHYNKPDLSDEHVSLKPDIKRFRFDTDFNKCIICQNKKKEKNAEASQGGIETFCRAALVRSDTVYERLRPDLETLVTKSNVIWHPNCYKSYTSKTNLEVFSKENASTSCSVKSSTKEYNADEYAMRSAKATLDWSRCIFCQQLTHKKDKQLHLVMTHDAERSIREVATIITDSNLKVSIANVDLIAQEAKYHKQCYSRNMLYAKRQTETDDVQLQCKYDMGFKQLIDDIHFPLIIEKKAIDMTVLLTKFKTIIKDDVPDIENYRSSKLKSRLMKHYGEDIVFQPQQGRNKPELVYSSTISIQDAINAAASLQSNKHQPNVQNDDCSASANIDAEVLFNAAALLRQDLKECVSLPCLSNNKVDPNDLTLERATDMFLKWVVEGYDHSNTSIRLEKTPANKHSTHRRIVSIGQDLIHTISRGEVIPPKHLSLAMAIKHVTGSKLLVTMLNRAGHSISYDEIQRVDTSAAEEIIHSCKEHGVVLPSNIRPSSVTLIEAAGDNIDINEETLDGKTTTHATSVVLYQHQFFSDGEYGVQPKVASIPTTKGRTRTLQERVCRKNLQEFCVSGKRPLPLFRNRVKLDWYHMGAVHEEIQNMDMTWAIVRLCPLKMFEVTLEKDPELQITPSWSAFNARVSRKHICPTTIGYCPLINANPTEYSTVYTVMKTVQKMMIALEQENTIITFDEAIYSKAKEIQWRVPDEFQNLILRMGGFHIALNFLSVIGHIYEETGIEDILIESGLFGSSSVSRILKGKMYNKGIRAHKLILEAFMRLRWASFSNWLEENDIMNDIDCDDYNEKLVELHNALANENDQRVRECTVELDKKISDLTQHLKHFSSEQQAKSDIFSFWEQYLEMVLILLRYIRAEREGDWEMHLSTVSEMIPYFFSCDHINYAKWATVYLADMKMLPEVAPHVYQKFQEGHHSISRSLNKFNSVWTDMALEQTINCDIKSKGGVIGFTKKVGALERWFVTAHLRAAITNQAKKMFGIEEGDPANSDACHKEASKPRIKQDEGDVQKLTHTIIEAACNPFTVDDETDGRLRNIVTGTIAPEEVSESLLKVKATGKQSMDMFINERLVDKNVHFYDPLKKTNLKTFTTTRRKVKAKTTGGKSVQVHSDRELFGRIMVVAKTRTVNLQEMFKYELAGVPLSLAKPDGTLNKSAKSHLMKELETLTNSTKASLPGKKDSALIIDGMALIQVTKTSDISTFGKLSENLFQMIKGIVAKNQIIRVDIVFDRYDVAHSIKAMERERRQNVATGYEVKIMNRNTKLPQQWAKFLCNPRNKANLSDFLSNDWCELAVTSMEPGQIFVTGGGFKDQEKAVMVRNRKLICNLPLLQANQEEADTRMLLHAQHAANCCERIIIWSPDTDVLLLCIYFCSILETDLWFKTGVKDKSRYISVTEMTEQLGTILCELVLPIHALTGCDSTSSFSGQGKVKPWKLVCQRPEKYQQLRNIGLNMEIGEETKKAAESFIADLYDNKSEGSLNSLRYKMFCQKQRSNEKLPPTYDSFQEHLKRANYQSYIWKNSLSAKPELPSPIGNGWKQDDKEIIPNLMTQSAAPHMLLALTTCGCKAGCTRKCSCASHGLGCTEACCCSGGDDCNNPHKADVDTLSDDDEINDDND